MNKPKKPLNLQTSFEKKNVAKEDYQKALKKLTLFFLSIPVPFNERRYQKQKGTETSDQSSG